MTPVKPPTFLVNVLPDVVIICVSDIPGVAGALHLPMTPKAAEWLADCLIGGAKCATDPKAYEALVAKRAVEPPVIYEDLAAKSLKA